MKKDNLLQQFGQKGLKTQKPNPIALSSLKKKKNVQPIDSGKLLSIKGGNDAIDPKVIITN